MLDADEAYIEELSAEVITVGKDGITKLTNDTIQTATIKAENVVGTLGEFVYLNAQQITGEKGDFEQLTAGIINSDEIHSLVIQGDQITGELGEFATINVGSITGTDAEFDTVGARFVTAENIVAGLVEAEQGDFDDLTANSAFIQYLNSGIIDVGTVNAEAVISALVQATRADFNTFTAQSGFVQFLNSGIIEASSISTQQLVAKLAQISQAEIENLSSDSAFIKYLESNLVVASEIDVDDLIAKLASIDVGNIETLYANNAFIRSLQSFTSTTATGVINDAYIYNAVANKISVADLKAGNITLTNNMKILSDNGALVMDGTALQILGEDASGNPYVGIQLGYDASNKPSLILRNEDGVAVFNTSTGVTEAGIAEGLIKNDMISNGTISESKLSFNVMKQGDTIAIENITTGGGSFGVEYTEFKNGTRDALDELRQDLADNAFYELYIEAPQGKNLRGGNITLNARLFRNSVDVTDQWDADYFIWKRHSLDSYGDEYWNESHSTGTKNLLLTGNDVHIEADFECCFEVNGISVASSNDGGE